MADSGSKGGSSAGALTIPAVLAALLAMLGISNMPGQRGASSPAPATTGVVPATDLAPPPGDTRLDRLLQAHRLDLDGQRLDLLEPLLRFYSPRLARLSGDELRDLRLPEKSGTPLRLDPDKVARWMVDPKKTGDDLQVLISIIPDPVRSGSAYRYDNTITAMLMAMRRAGFVLDGSRINWRPAPVRRPTTAADPATVPAAPALPSSAAIVNDAGTERPGVLLMRRPMLAKADGEKTSHELILILLVAETPVRGVHTAMLQASLDLASECHTAASPGTKPLARLIGPHFSGSPSSIVRTLKPWINERILRDPESVEAEGPIVHWVNGVAISMDVARLDHALNRAGRRDVRLENVVYGSNDMNRALFSYIADRSRPIVGNHRVAFVTEETTGFGGQVGGKSDRVGPFEVYRYTFPLHIAEVRRRYEQQSGQSQQSVNLKSAERLTIDVGEGSDAAEMIQQEAPSLTSASDELRLLRVARDINRRGIRFISLSATDVRDRIFVAEFLRTHCSDALIVSTQIDPAFTHHQRIAQLRGILFASTYPIWIETTDRRPLNLPDHGAYATFNATLAQLASMYPKGGYEKRVVGYGWPGDVEPSRPPVWVTLTSQQGFLPLRAAIPSVSKGFAAAHPVTAAPSGTAAPVELKNGEYIDSMWVPGHDGPESHGGRASSLQDLIFTMKRAVAITSGASLALPLLLGLGSLWVCSYCLGRSRRLREQVWIETCYPLPTADSPDPEATSTAAANACYLHTTQANARTLLSLSDPTSGRLYRRPLRRLGLFVFAATWLYAWLSAFVISNSGAFLALLVLCGGTSLICYRVWAFSPPRGDVGPATVVPLLRRCGLTLAVIWILMVLISPPTLSWIQSRPLPASWSRWHIAIHSLVLATVQAAVLIVVLLVVRMTRRPRRLLDATETLPFSAILGTVLGASVVGFVLFCVTTHERRAISLPLILLLAFLFASILHESIHLQAFWNRLKEFTDSVLSLPLGGTFDALPRRLTSRLGSYQEALEGKADPELADRLVQLRQSLARALEQDAASPPTSGVTVDTAAINASREALLLPSRAESNPPGPLASRALATLLEPVWSRRGPQEAYADQDSAPAAAPAAPSPVAVGGLAVPADENRAALRPRTVEMADTYVALEVVRYLNRYLDLLWLRVTMLTVLTLLLMATVNGYPFQPSGTLFRWTMVVVVLAVAVIVRILVGFNRNELISRVNKVTVDRSIWNMDFLAKMLAYVGPVIALLAALSVGISDFLRLILGPLAR